MAQATTSTPRNSTQRTPAPSARRTQPPITAIISSPGEPVVLTKTYEYRMPFSDLTHVAGIVPPYKICRAVREKDKWRFFVSYYVIWEDMSRRPDRAPVPRVAITDRAIERASKDAAKLDPAQTEIELALKTWRKKVLAFCIGVVSGRIAIGDGDELVIVPPFGSQNGKIEIRKFHPEIDM